MLPIYEHMTLDCILGGTLSHDFADGNKLLMPILFSHGILGCNSTYSGLLKDMASHGYIVFALNHMDGTCIYTEDSQGKPGSIEFYDYFDKENRKRQIEIRVQEIISAVSDLTQM